MSNFTHFIRSAVFLLFFIVCTKQILAQTGSAKKEYHLLSGDNFVQSKNYYLLTLFQQLRPLRKLLQEDIVFRTIGATKYASIRKSLDSCDRDGLCYTSTLRFSISDIAKVSDRLAELCVAGSRLDRLVQDHLRPSGTYILLDRLPNAQMLAKAWEQDANGINYSIGIYGEGEKPHYPNIDSISFNTRDPRNNNTYLYNYTSLLYNTISLIRRETTDTSMFFKIPLLAALHFLEMNERNQVTDYEPMTATENRLAFTAIKSIKWHDFPYSVIVVPGAGPEEPGVALSAEGMIRCRLAALEYRHGNAPFIMPSGGKVHPYKTKFCEAVEMKKYLMTVLHIPEQAIIIEPHARHTTTNMRNAARLIFRYGIPFDKVAVTITTKGQSSMISNTLAARCMKELNEVPFRNGKRISETTMEFFPTLQALHINPTEPIDP